MRCKTKFRASFILVALLAIANIVSAQEPAKKKFEITVPYDGVELFARLLDDAGLTPIKTLDELAATPAEKSILIVFGDPTPLELLETRRGGVGEFLDRGGAVLIASDRKFSFAKIPSLGLGQTEIGQGDLTNHMRHLTFQGQHQCPIISLPDNSPDPDHLILKGIRDKIATNCPGEINIRRGLEPLLKLPRFTAPEGYLRNMRDDPVGVIRKDPTGVFDELGQDRTYMAVSPDRRLAVVAGHGVFMNCLAVRKDIANGPFADKLIEWLKEKKRSRVCFLHEGEAVTNFKLPLAGPPRPPIPSVEAINKILDVIQNEQLLQKVIDNSEVFGPERIATTALYVATLGLLFYGAKKYFQSRWTLEAAPSPLEGGAKLKPPLIVQRQRELARKNELGEPAQALARDWFGSYASLTLRPGQPLPKMTYQVKAGLLQRFKLARQVDSLWALAGDPHPRGWTSKRLHGLTAILEELSLAVIAGEIEFVSEQG